MGGNSFQPDDSFYGCCGDWTSGCPGGFGFLKSVNTIYVDIDDQVGRGCYSLLNCRLYNIHERLLRDYPLYIHSFDHTS